MVPEEADERIKRCMCIYIYSEEDVFAKGGEINAHSFNIYLFTKKKVGGGRKKKRKFAKGVWVLAA